MKRAGVLLVVGCAGDPDPVVQTTTGDPPGACGALSSIATLTISGRVRDDQQNWLEGADIALEERNWSPGRIHGAGRSGAGGWFTVTASDLPVLEDCWGTAVQFWLVGETDALWGDQPVNPYVIDAYEGGLTSVSTGAVPLILRPR